MPSKTKSVLSYVIFWFYFFCLLMTLTFWWINSFDTQKKNHLERITNEAGFELIKSIFHVCASLYVCTEHWLIWDDLMSFHSFRLECLALEFLFHPSIDFFSWNKKKTFWFCFFLFCQVIHFDQMFVQLLRQWTVNVKHYLSTECIGCTLTKYLSFCLYFVFIDCYRWWRLEALR